MNKVGGTERPYNGLCALSALRSLHAAAAHRPQQQGVAGIQAMRAMEQCAWVIPGRGCNPKEVFQISAVPPPISRIGNNQQYPNFVRWTYIHMNRITGGSLPTCTCMSLLSSRDAIEVQLRARPTPAGGRISGCKVQGVTCGLAVCRWRMAWPTIEEHC